MPDTFLVFLGGGIGSLLRFFTGKIFSMFIPAFPIATLVSNMSGCFILGIAFSIYGFKNNNSGTYIFFATGICGGYSTFSTFTLESLQLFQSGNYSTAVINIGLNLLLCFISLLSGIFIARFFS